ncbi:cytochrome c551 [Halobacillus sp. A5]|uniref:cytochrome c551 n=1 Tax=Halobacillus sp. A5 TaxID=2880263 RepID=UPI0020A6D6F1|nr:cytochrome c [Halobacillus sp. A5]MCP3028125.1 cytochrome c [Halobacillus sp. A5]
MKKFLWAMLISFVFILGACGGSGDEEGGDDSGETEESSEEQGDSDGDVEAAEQVYEQSCATCHGGDMEGNVGPALNEIGSKYSAEEIQEIIHNGKGSMQAQNVEDQDAEVVAEWLASME